MQRLVIMCCLLWGSLPLFGLSQPGYVQSLRPSIQEIPAYQAEGRHKLVKMAFAEHRIRNPRVFEALGDSVVQQVDLVFTRYPFHLETWEINYDTLMERRYAALEEILPRAFRTPGVQWRIVLQTQGKDLKAATKLFHGFVVYYGPGKTAPEPKEVVVTEAPKMEEVEPERPVLRFDTAELRRGWENAEAILEGEKEFYDSTALAVLAAHPEWANMVLVGDWTASMYRYGAQVIRHVRQGSDRDRVLGYVFFNDGDGKYDDEKEVGLTGGIYHARAGKVTEVQWAVRSVLMGGNGGDHRENDLEAVVYALDEFPDCGELVLIADNRGPVRDMVLLEYIDRPVNIILCGVYHEEVQPDYFTIAYRTGGSVYTRERAFEQFDQLPLGPQFQLGEYEYTLRMGRFVRKEIR